MAFENRLASSHAVKVISRWTTHEQVARWCKEQADNDGG
jgi:heme-degrading monooxygenase HmoA